MHKLLVQDIYKLRGLYQFSFPSTTLVLTCEEKEIRRVRYASQLHLGTCNCIRVSSRNNYNNTTHFPTQYTAFGKDAPFFAEQQFQSSDFRGKAAGGLSHSQQNFPLPIPGLPNILPVSTSHLKFLNPSLFFISALFSINWMGRPKGDGARSKARPSSSRCWMIIAFSFSVNFNSVFFFCSYSLDKFNFSCAFSLAASLLPSDSAANAAGFGGFLGSYRLDYSLTGDDAAPFSVCRFRRIDIPRYCKKNCLIDDSVFVNGCSFDDCCAYAGYWRWSCTALEKAFKERPNYQGNLYIFICCFFSTMKQGSSRGIKSLEFLTYE